MDVPQKKFGCNFCDKFCSTAVKLKNHIHFKHNNVPTCDKCGKTFSQRSKLVRHSKIHTKQKNQTFRCPLCDFTASERKEMLRHYTLHNYDMSTEALNFISPDEFHSWLEEVSKTTQAKFVNTGIAWVLKGGSKCIIYKCHRDGFFSPRGKNIRRHLNSNKINGFCPASIKVITTAQGGIEATYLKTHVGHGQGDGRVPLKQKKESLPVSEKSTKRVSIESLFDSAKESFLPPDAKAVLLSEKKILSLIGTYGLTDEATIKSDFPSFDAWIEHMMNSSWIHFCKPVGSFCVEYPSIKAEDFLLVVMTDSQRALIEEFGHNCICIDKVPDVKTDYQMFYLSVVDHLNHGFPCALFLTNREDAVALEIFFIVVRNVINKKLITNVFLSDTDDMFYNMWSLVMGRPNYRLYSPWLIDKLWRENAMKIQDKENKVEVYKNVKSLMFERNLSSFESSISTFMNYLYGKEKTRDFATYFERFYINPFPWAHCHWLNAGLNINFYSLENNYFIVNKFYDKRKKVPLDKILTLLLKFVKDELYEKMVLWNDLSLFNKLVDLRKSHLAANNLSCAIIEEDNDKWFVTSENEEENGLVIRSLKSSCLCPLQCDDCACCIHRYDCTCQESTVYWRMCKHIHFLNLGLRKFPSEVVEVSAADSAPSIQELHPLPLDGASFRQSDRDSKNEESVYHEDESWETGSNHSVDWLAKREDLCAEFKDAVQHVHSEEAFREVKKIIGSLIGVINAAQP